MALARATNILILVCLLAGCVLATPSLGVRPDHLKPTNRDKDRDIQSYSSIIKFEDPTIPLDKTKMTDAKLLHLCVSAYNEMVNLWRNRNLTPEGLPGAMAAVAYKDRIYFASSIKAKAWMVDLLHVHQGTIRTTLDACLWMGLGVHKHRGGCAELNGIELLWTHNGLRDPDKIPAPRIAVWVLPGDRNIDTNGEINAPPCSYATGASPGYGCADILLNYGIEPIDSKVVPDATGEDDWKFSVEANPRPPCPRPKT